MMYSAVYSASGVYCYPNAFREGADSPAPFLQGILPSRQLRSSLPVCAAPPVAMGAGMLCDTSCRQGACVFIQGADGRLLWTVLA